MRADSPHPPDPVQGNPATPADYPGREAVEAALAGRLVVVTPEAHKAYGFVRAVRGVRVLTAACEACVAPLRQAGAEVVSLGPIGDAVNSTRRLVSSPDAKAQLGAWAGGLAVVFRPDFKTAQLLEAAGLQVLSADPGVARRLENKRAFRALCRRAGIPVAPSVEVSWPATWDDVAARLEGRAPRLAADGLASASADALIVQTARGFGGKRTWRWRRGEPPDLGEALAGRKVLVSPHLEGPTWTVNAVAFPDGVWVGPPMRQIHGDARLSALTFGSSGVAFAPAGGEQVAAELRGLAERVGRLAAAQGFAGFFGIDAVGPAGGLRLIEMNARLTASLTAATLAELAAGRMPLTVAHLLACLGRPAPSDDGAFKRPVQGGHLIVREAPGVAVCTPISPATFRPGRGQGFARLSADAGWPAVGQVCVWRAGEDAGGPAEERCRLLFASQMVDADGRFTEAVEAVVDALVSSEPEWLEAVGGAYPKYGRTPE